MAVVVAEQNVVVRKISAWSGSSPCRRSSRPFYGMNFEHMPELGWRRVLSARVAVMVGLAVGFYVLFKRA